MQSSYEEKCRYEESGCTSFFKTFPCIILLFAFPQRLVYAMVGFFDGLLGMAG